MLNYLSYRAIAHTFNPSLCQGENKSASQESSLNGVKSSLNSVNKVDHLDLNQEMSPSDGIKDNDKSENAKEKLSKEPKNYEKAVVSDSLTDLAQKIDEKKDQLSSLVSTDKKSTTYKTADRTYKTVVSANKKVYEDKDGKIQAVDNTLVKNDNK